MVRGLVIAACCVLCAPSATALDLPLRKAGLWELSMTFLGRDAPPRLMQHCVDEKTDKLMNANYGGPVQPECSKNDIKHVGDTITVDSVCKFGSASMTSHATFTGNFTEAYTVNISTVMDGGRAGAAPELRTKIEARWAGACKADQRPGDVVMVGGTKYNVLDPPKAASRRR